MHSCRSNKGRRCSRRRGSIPLSSTLALAGLSPACIASPGSFFYRRGGRGSAAADRYADVCVTDLRVTFFRRGDRFARLTGGRRTPGRSRCFRSASTAVARPLSVRRGQVRIRLPPGGRWIRTIGPWRKAVGLAGAGPISLEASAPQAAAAAKAAVAAASSSGTGGSFGAIGSIAAGIKNLF